MKFFIDTPTAPQPRHLLPPLRRRDHPSREAHQGSLIKGNWDTKTTRCTTIWLVTRPSTKTYPEHQGDSKESLNRRGARNLTCIGEASEESQVTRTRTHRLETQASSWEEGTQARCVERVEQVARRGIWSVAHSARHGRPVIRRVLQATRNSDQRDVGSCAPTLQLASRGA
jgi:hypothetical protein